MISCASHEKYRASLFGPGVTRVDLTLAPKVAPDVAATSQRTSFGGAPRDGASRAGDVAAGDLHPTFQHLGMSENGVYPQL